jgi:hypothetical protein
VRFKLLLERFPDKYPYQKTLTNRFKISEQHISELIEHYEFIEKLSKVLPPTQSASAERLPEWVVREIRRADPEYWATLVKAYFKSVDEGKPLGVAGVVALVDGFSHSASLLSTNRVF